MTPAEINAAIEGHNLRHQQAVALAWLGAALQRQKRLPPLSRLLGGEKKRRDPQDLRRELAQLMEELGGNARNR